MASAKERFHRAEQLLSTEGELRTVLGLQVPESLAGRRQSMRERYRFSRGIPIGTNQDRPRSSELA